MSTNMEQRWEQHKRSGGKLTLEQFAERAFERDFERDMRRGPRSERIELANEVLGDLPDGAFFAAAKDMFGLQPEDWA